MDQDITIVVHVGGHEYQARLLNDRTVRISLDGALVGSGEWDGAAIVRRSDSLGPATDLAVEVELRRQLTPPN